MLTFQRLLLLLLSITALFVMIPPASATDYTVNCNADPATRANDLIVAIVLATTLPSDDVIQLAANCTYSLTSAQNVTNGGNGLPVIANNGKLTIEGNGATITRNSGTFRLLYVAAGTDLTLKNLTLSNGSSDEGGAIYNNGGTVTLQHTTVANNYGEIGGGFYNNGGTVTVERSAFTNNSANTGGGFYNTPNGMTTVVSSTFANNSAVSKGGGFFNYNTNLSVANPSVVLRNSTFSGNTSATGGGFFNENGTTQLFNTIVANSSGGDCYSFGANAWLNGSHNIIETACSGTFINGLTNTLAVDPELDPAGLANNGGSTQTIALLQGSPAIDAGDNSSTPGANDQRGTGYSRIRAVTVDIGAYEVGCVNNYNVLPGDVPDLIHAINCANTDGDQSVISLAENSTYSLTSIDNDGYTTYPNGLPIIQNDDPLLIVGQGATITRAAGSPSFRLFYVNLNASLYLESITLSNGHTIHNGGAIATYGQVSIYRSTLSGNTSTGVGGAIWSDYSGGVTISHSTITGNSASQGGGLANTGFANLTLRNATVAGNTGGGLYNSNSTANLYNTILANNTGGNCALASSAVVNGNFNLIEGGCTNNASTNNLAVTLTVDPMLDELTGNPAYFPLQPGSPAIDAGNNINLVGSVDQIGQPRPIDDTGVVDTGSGTGAVVDLGAVERQTASLSRMSINDITLTEGNIGTKSFTFTVSINPASIQTITVDYTTADSSATANADYIPMSGTLTFDPGETSQTITVLVNGDLTYEPGETFNVNLSNAINATMTDNQGDGLITNDDDQPVIVVNNLTRTEGGSGTQTNMPFTITLSNPSYQPITVFLATSDGTATVANSDYTPINLTGLYFAPGVTSRNVTVKVTGDGTHEPHETVHLNLSSPTNATIADNLGVGTIVNDDTKPTITINDVSRAEGSSGTTNFPFVVTLSNPSYQTITVSFATSDGTATLANNDYISRSGVLSFAPGVTSRQITVQGNGDTIVEPNEIFNLYLSSPTNASVADNRGIGTITNDDSAGLVTPLALSAGAASVNEGQSATYTIALNAAPAELLGADSLNVALSFDPAYLSVTPASLTFDATHWNIPQTVTIMAVDDQQALQASISLPVLHMLTAGDVTLNGAPFGVTITDNDALLVPVAPELPQIEAIAPVSPDTPSADVPGVMLVSPVRETSENPVAFTWIGAADAVAYRVLVQTQADRAVVIDQTISVGSCNGNICVFVSQFAPQSGISYVWTVTPITASGAGAPSAEAGFSYSPSAPDGIELPGTIIGQ